MVIQNNLTGLNAYNRLNSNVRKTTKASAALASGLRINSSADDASGLAISEKMRSQIRGLKQAGRNCQDGINLIRTFEGALEQSQDMIKRCAELAYEAANGIYDDPTDRAALQLEFDQLRKEIDAVSDTDFNGVLMLNGGELASVAAKQTGTNWLNPGTVVDWQAESIINRTDPYDPDFSMVISKLPALDDMTIITDDEAEALREFNNAPISVDLDEGKARFYFSGDPVPERLSIETRGNTGYISINTAGSVIEIAKVTLPGVTRALKAESYGKWSSAIDKCSLSTPRSEIDFTSPAFPLGNGDSAAKYTQLRADYDEWIRTIPTVGFTVAKNDLEKFTIPAQYKDNVVGYSEDKIYNRGDTITVISKIRDKTVYTDVKVDWDPAVVKPGATENVTRGSYSDRSGNWSFSKGSTTNHTYVSSKNPAYSIGTVSNTTMRKRFLAHGAETFNITYRETSVGSDGKSQGYWSISISNYDNSEGYKDNVKGTTLTIDSNKDPAAVNHFFSELGLSKSTLVDGLSIIHKNGNLIPSVQLNPDGTPKHNFTIKNNQSYSFSFTTKPSAPSTSSFTAWSTSKNSYTLNKFDPAKPDSGGIDYNRAEPGTYTYHNDHTDEGVAGDPGYWTDPKGEKIELAEAGIFLSKSMLTSISPLHDGFSLAINESMTGPSGKMTGTAALFKLDITEILSEPDLGGLTYAETLVLQTNSRTKDSVEFTFTYHSETQGDLKCDLNCSGEGLGIDKLDISNQKNANLAIDKLSESLNKVSMVRSCFGAAQNRLEQKISNLTTTSENITESESYIRDADMARETMKFTKSQILSQAAQSMLSQANQMPQSVLQLLQ